MEPIKPQPTDNKSIKRTVIRVCLAAGAGVTAFIVSPLGQTTMFIAGGSGGTSSNHNELLGI